MSSEARSFNVRESTQRPMILELPAPKEVSMIWDLNLTASSSSQGFSLFTRSRDRQSATNTPSDRCCPGSLLTSSAICTARSTGASLRAASVSAKICPWASRNAFRRGYNPPDRLWINVGSRAIVKVSSTYLSHLVLCCASSHQN